jgi:hypothetical protein
VVINEKDPDAMDPNALYYALSTIAQCAAALAALIGFLGLWRLDRLREIRREDEDEMIAVMLQLINRAGDFVPIRGRAHFLQRAREFVQGLSSPPRPWVTPEGTTIDEKAQQIIAATLRPLLTHYDALAVQQQGLLWALRGFLIVTLVILGAAVVGFLYVDQATTWAWTPWLLWIAGSWLAVGPIIVVLTAARLRRAIVALTLLLVLASSAWAATPPRCLTYEEKSLGRWQTICDDGSRAVSTWNRTLERWDTTVTPPPGQRCTGRLNPTTHPWEGRCR